LLAATRIIFQAALGPDFGGHAANRFLALLFSLPGDSLCQVYCSCTYYSNASPDLFYVVLGMAIVGVRRGQARKKGVFETSQDVA
jgi:hypothetical protein